MLKKLSGLILYLLITLLVITIYLDQPAVLEKWEMAIFDKMFQLKGKRDIPGDIQIIAIDDVSLQFVEKWPWHRNRLAELLEKVAQQQPKVIYLDIPFSDNPVEDSLGYTKMLADQIKKAGNVILPYRYSFSDYSISGVPLPDYIKRNTFINIDDPSKFGEYPPLTAGNVYPPTKLIAESAYRLGFFGVSFDRDRYVRSEPLILKYAGEYLPSASFTVVQSYLDISQSKINVNVGKSIDIGLRKIPIDENGRMRINFNGSSGVFRTISANDILSDTIGKRELTGKIAIIAFTATGSIELYSTPVCQAMHGVEITANAIENVIHNHFLMGFGTSGTVNLLLILMMGTFAAIILPRISLLYRIVVLGLSLFLMANLSFVLFTSFDMEIKIFYPMIMILFFMIASPTIKTHSEAGETTDDEEIDYEELLAGTPITGVVTVPENSGTPTRTAIQPRGNQKVETRTMPINEEGNELLVGAENFGRYRVIDTIGKGAMGMVYKGLDPAIDRPVALKTIRLDNIVDSRDVLELKERLNREAKAAGKLSHPNIVTIYDVGEEQSLQYIAMEYLEGQTLEALINSGYNWDYKTLCKIMIQICEALDFAHEHGIVHRDIKPANIMVLENDRVKVMDFGIARFDSSNMTQSGTALGTPNYISPEQLKGKKVDRRSDIFSLGVVFYEILTGKKPFKGDTISALIYSILHTSPPPPSEINLEVPRIFDKIIAKALVKDPDLRFQTAREMADILRKLI